MNSALLPNFCALLVFIGAFRPLARRAGPHTNAWFIGWIFVLLHHAALILTGSIASQHVSLGLLGEWALELGGIWFLRAAANAPNTMTSALLTTEMGFPILLQSLLVICHVGHPVLHAFSTLLLCSSGVHLLLVREARSRLRVQMAWGFAGAGIFLAPLAAIDAPLALSLVHCLLFLGAAILYWDYREHTTRGLFTAVGGLALWGLTYPLDMLLDRAEIGSPLLAAVWQFPSYIVAYGLMLTLIEEHVHRTEELALHDPLTGLPNRRLFEDRLEQALAVAPNNGCILACLVIDVDHFKSTNDTLGHAAGDGLLQGVAQRLSWQIRAGDTLARTGGDEFAVILTRLQSLEHLRFTVGALMSATIAPIIVGEQAVDVSLSIGIAIYPDVATDADGLRSQADDAMYEAKRKGGNQFAYAGGPPDELARLLGEVSYRPLPPIEVSLR